MVWAVRAPAARGRTLLSSHSRQEAAIFLIAFSAVVIVLAIIALAFAF